MDAAAPDDDELAQFLRAHPLPDDCRHVGPQGKHFEAFGIAFTWSPDTGERLAHAHEPPHNREREYLPKPSLGAPRVAPSSKKYAARRRLIDADGTALDEAAVGDRERKWAAFLRATFQACASGPSKAEVHNRELEREGRVGRWEDEDEDEKGDRRVERKVPTSKPPSAPRQRAGGNANDKRARLLAAGYKVWTAERPNGGRADLQILSPAGKRLRSYDEALRHLSADAA
jgi:hypothetical protein